MLYYTAPYKLNCHSMHLHELQHLQKA